MTIYMADLYHVSTQLYVAVFDADDDSDARAKTIKHWGSFLIRNKDSFAILVKEPQRSGFWLSERRGIGSIAYDTEQEKFWWHDYIHGQKQYLYRNGNLTGSTINKGVHVR